MTVRPSDFSWSDQLAVGDALIDSAHRQLFNLAAHMACETTWNGILAAAIELHRHLAMHLALEEGLMRQHAYPGYPSHLCDHQRIVQQLDRLSADVAAARWDPHRLHEFIHRVVAEHIVLHDRPMADHVHHGPSQVNTDDTALPTWIGRVAGGVPRAGAGGL